MSDSQEKTFGELLSEGIGKMKTDLAAALAANQRLEKERDEANAFIRLQESEFQDKWKCLSAERDRLIADVVQYRRVLEKVRKRTEGRVAVLGCEEIRDAAAEALAAEHPGAPAK